jgi:hypothetical protein
MKERRRKRKWKRQRNGMKRINEREVKKEKRKIGAEHKIYDGEESRKRRKKKEMY